MSAALKQASVHLDTAGVHPVSPDGQPAAPQRCAVCCLRKQCLAAAFLEGPATAHPGEAPIHYDRGTLLHGMGEPASLIYVITAGSVKVFFTTEQGQEQIVRFALPGDIIGLDAIGHAVHGTSATALERTTVCVIPQTLLRSACARDPQLNQHLFRAFSEHCGQTQRLLEWITHKDTDARLASFLLQLAERFRSRGFSDQCLHLSMSRSDIANFLGIAVETVSRVLGRFQKAGLVGVERRRVFIRDRHTLEAIAGCADQGATLHREAG